MRVSNPWARHLAALAVLVVAGCGSGGFHPVKGKVMLEGKPMVGGGSITLMPLEGKPGQAAAGEIADDGTYTLSTRQPGDGVAAGEFRVMIAQTTHGEGKRTKDGEAPSKPVSVVKEADRIPDIYGDAQNSPLRAKVEPKANLINFDLKRTP